MGVQTALLDVDEVAELLNVSVRHVRRLVFERRIPFLKSEHLVRFDRRNSNAGSPTPE